MSLPAPPRITEVLPGVFRWSSYSPEHRVELTSHAVSCRQNLLVFDPIDVEVDGLTRLLSGVSASVILTNRNHERAALDWFDRWGISVFAVNPWKNGRLAVGRLEPGSDRFAGCRWMELDGGAPGESAFLFQDRSLAVFGDAVVNLPGRSLELLPAKYCDDPERLAASLGVLASEWQFSNALFAHGDALVGGADRRIAALLHP